jgi:hypothetical protein
VCPVVSRQSDVRIKVAPLLPHGWLNMYFTGDPVRLRGLEGIAMPKD